MRRLVVAALLVGSLAHANPGQIAKAVTTNIVELGKLADDDALKLTSDAVVIAARGQTVDLAREDGCTTGAVANAMYGCQLADLNHLPGKVTSDSVGDVGWFLAPYTVRYEPDDRDTKPQVRKESARAGGIVLRTGKQWAIAGVMYTTAVSDAELLARSDGQPASGAPKLAGDAGLAKVVAGWFTTGFAPMAAAKGTLLASGTAPSELATGAAAVALAKRWDQLSLGATIVDAKLLAGGKIGWVRAEVMMPRKKAKGAAALQLVVIVIPDGSGGWRWVSMQYQPGFRIG